MLTDRAPATGALSGVFRRQRDQRDWSLNWLAAAIDSRKIICPFSGAA
jgi:hypothetical protein